MLVRRVAQIFLFQEIVAVAGVSSITADTSASGLNVIKDTVRGAFRGQVADIAKVAAAVGVAAGAIPASTGLAVAAGGELIGLAVDVFA